MCFELVCYLAVLFACTLCFGPSIQHAEWPLFVGLCVIDFWPIPIGSLACFGDSLGSRLGAGTGGWVFG